MKRFNYFLAVLLVLLTLPGQAWAAAKIDLAFGGVLVPTERTEENTTPFYLEARPQMRSNTVFVPVRVVSEIMGAEVRWQEPNIIIKLADTEIKLTLGGRTAVKNGQEMKLPAAPYERGGYTYVPIRFVAEAFDCDVEWQAKKNLVNIKTQPWELDGRLVTKVASQVRMTSEIFSYEVTSPLLADRMYKALQSGIGAEVAAPQYYGRHINMDPPNFYYGAGEFYFLTADDNVAACLEIYEVLGNGYNETLPDGYTRCLLRIDDKWYAFSDEALEQAQAWWFVGNSIQVKAEGRGYKPYAKVVEGVNLNYLACYSRLGMSRSLDCYSDKLSVAYIYETLQDSLLREVAEPETAYGALFEVQDYYVEHFMLGFSEDKPQAEAYLNESSSKADFTFYFYEMLEGQPEFGEDSKCLVYAEHTDKWYVLDPQAFAEVEAYKAYLSEFDCETLLYEQA